MNTIQYVLIFIFLYCVNVFCLLFFKNQAKFLWKAQHSFFALLIHNYNKMSIMFFIIIWG